MLKKATKIMCWFACVYILICGNEKEIFAQVERQYVTATIENTWPDKYPYVAKLKVYLDSKYEIEKVYDSGSSGVYGSVEVGDLTGDGQNEVVVNLSWIGSTYAATDTYVYMIEDEKLVEVLHLDGDNISQFDSMFQTCAGAKIQDGNLCISGIIDKYDNFDSVVIGCKDGIWEVIDSENEKELKTNAESNNNKKVISTKVVDLEDSKTYKQYDITGDGKADTLKIKKKAVYHMSGDLYDWKIMVNGKKVFEVDAKEEKNISVKLYSVSKNRTYLYIREGHVWFHEMIDCGLYQYKKGKLKKVVDLYGDVKKCVASYEISIEIEKMTKNKITVIYSDQLNATGRIDWKVTYVRKKGKWKRKSATCKTTEPNKIWTTNRKIKVFTKTNGKKKAFTLKKGAQVKIKKICVKKNSIYLQVTKKNGKKGWIKNPKTFISGTGFEKNGEWYSGDGYFYEARFAG